MKLSLALVFFISIVRADVISRPFYDYATLSRHVQKILQKQSIRPPTEGASDWFEEEFPELKSKALRESGEFEVKFSGERNSGILKEVMNEFLIPQNYETELFFYDQSRHLVSEAPLWDQHEAQSYVQSLCNRLNFFKNPHLRCHIYASLSPYAFSYPGGEVFLTAGLIYLLKTEDALAFFLAHEIMHIADRHASRNLQAHLPRQWIDDKNPLDRKLEDLFSSGREFYNIEDEYRADRLALELIENRGYSRDLILTGVREYKKFWQLQGSHDHQDRNPSWDMRLRFLEASAPAFPFSARTPLKNDSELQKLQAPLRFAWQYYLVSIHK